MTLTSSGSALETPFTESSDSPERCANPLCHEILEPKKKHAPVKLYCGDKCRQDVWILRRAAEMLEGLSQNALGDILMKVKGG